MSLLRFLIVSCLLISGWQALAVSDGQAFKPNFKIYRMSKNGKLTPLKHKKSKRFSNRKTVDETFVALVGATERIVWHNGYTSTSGRYLNFSITGSPHFSIVSNSCVGSHGPCDVVIDFAPTAKGITTATFSFEWLTYPGPKVPPSGFSHSYEFSGEAYKSDKPECEAKLKGSIIRVEDQSLSEVVPIVGTDFDLYYSSNHAADFVADYSKPTRVNSFNPEGWTVSIVHRYDQANNRLFLGTGKSVIRTSLPAGGTDVMVVNDGEVYVFDSTGKHLQTKSFLTGFVKYYFTYSGSSKLTKITDAMGLETVFGRNGSGVLQTITSPYSQITNISVDGSGLISEIENPNSESYEFTYISGTELMETFKRPGGETSNFSYRLSGELETDAGAGGNSWNLGAGFDGLFKYTIKQTAEDRVSWILTDKDSSTGQYTRISASDTGFETEYKENTDQSYEVTNSYESTATQTTNDERFGSAQKRVSEVVETINGLTRTTQYS